MSGSATPPVKTKRHSVFGSLRRSSRSTQTSPSASPSTLRHSYSHGELARELQVEEDRSERSENSNSEADRKRAKRITRRLLPYGPKAPEVLRSMRDSGAFVDADEDEGAQELLWKEVEDELNQLLESKEDGEDPEAGKSVGTFSHVQEIRNLVTTFFSDFEGKPVELLSALLLVMVLPNQRDEPTGRTLGLEDPAWRSGRYFMKFAAAAYGNMLSCLKMRKRFFQYWWGDVDSLGPATPTRDGARKGKAGFFAVPPKGDKRVVFEHTGIADEDFIAGHWGAGVARGGSEFLPGYVLCRDHNSSNLVLALRGSSNLNDALTDLVGNYEQYRDGAVHRGMIRMTRRLMEKLLDTILKELEDHPSWGLVVCGHSLGAGIASLFTLLFHDTQPQYRVHGYAYACPCTMDAVLAKYCRPFLNTYVYGDDCVSRISLGSLEEMKLTVRHFMKVSGTGIGSRLYHITKQLTGIQSSRLASLFRVSKERAELTLADRRGEHRMEKLYPPGNIYHIFRTEKGVLQGELSHYTRFGHIVISSTMFTDHMPHTYEKVLKKLSDPCLETAKSYHRRFLRTYGSKWVSRNSTLAVSLNPLYGRHYALCELITRMTVAQEEVLQLIRRLWQARVARQNVCEFTRVYETESLSVSFVPQLSLPLGVAAVELDSSQDSQDPHSPRESWPRPAIPMLSDSLLDSPEDGLGVLNRSLELPLTEEPSLTETALLPVSSDSDQFFSCEELSDKQWQMLLLEQAVPLSGVDDGSLTASTEIPVAPLESSRSLSFNSREEIQLLTPDALYRYQQHLRQFEKELQVRELLLAEKEAALKEREERLRTPSKKKRRIPF